MNENDCEPLHVNLNEGSGSHTDYQEALVTLNVLVNARMYPEMEGIEEWQRQVAIESVRQKLQDIQEVGSAFSNWIDVAENNGLFKGL